MIACACGIPRSGSTLVAQLMRGCLPDWEIVATHPAAMVENLIDGVPNIFTIASYRDPRDIAASRYRVRLSRAGRTSGDWADLEAEIAEMSKQILAFLSLWGVTFSRVRYEDFWNDHGVIFDLIEAMFAIRIGDEHREKLSKRYSLLANAARAATHQDFNTHDESGIHGHHIATPKPGGWRHVLPVELHDKMLDATRVACEALGYE